MWFSGMFATLPVVDAGPAENSSVVLSGDHWTSPGRSSVRPAIAHLAAGQIDQDRARRRLVT